MAVLEQRVAGLEGRVQEHVVQIADVRQEMRDLRAEFRAFRTDMDRWFAWLVGIVISGFVLTVGTIAGAFWGLLQTLR